MPVYTETFRGVCHVLCCHAARCADNRHGGDCNAKHIVCMLRCMLHIVVTAACSVVPLGGLCLLKAVPVFGHAPYSFRMFVDSMRCLFARGL